MTQKKLKSQGEHGERGVVENEKWDRTVEAERRQT